MLYEINDQVRDNILKLIARVQITGAEAPAILEIHQALSRPVPKPEQKKIKAEEK